MHLHAWGMHSHIFPINCAPNKIFSTLKGARAPSASPGYTYGLLRFWRLLSRYSYLTVIDAIMFERRNFEDKK